MSETPEDPAETTTEIATPTAHPAEPVIVERKPNRLYQVLAWVGIIAGTVFIVAVVFFSGFILGKASGGGHGHFRNNHHGHEMMMERGGPPPFMRPGFGGGGPGMFGPGPGPGNFGPGPGNFGPGGPGGPGQSGGPGQPTQTPAPPR